MPRFPDLPAEDTLARILNIGFSKSGKTHWGAEAAEAGFNVIYLDGDNSKQTISKMSKEALKRIYYFDCSNTMKMPRFNRIIHAAITETPLMWDDTQQRIWRRGMTPIIPENRYWEVDFTKLTSNDVVITDTWTQLVWSIMWDWALDHGEDLGDMEQANRSMYQGIGNRATAMIQTLKYLPCHLIVNAHPDEYIKRKPQKGRQKSQKEADVEIEWSRMIPKSTSKPHGLTLGKEFNDILWIEAGHLNARRIDARTNPGREGGSHWTEIKSTEEYSFANLVKAIGGAAPIKQDSCAGIIEYEPGEFSPPTPGGNKIINADTSKPAAPANSLASLIRSN